MLQLKSHIEQIELTRGEYWSYICQMARNKISMRTDQI